MPHDPILTHESGSLTQPWTSTQSGTIHRVARYVFVNKNPASGLHLDKGDASPPVVSPSSFQALRAPFFMPVRLGTSSQTYWEV